MASSTQTIMHMLSDQVLSDLRSNTATHISDYCNSASYGDVVRFSRVVCGVGLARLDCATCIDFAFGRIKESCRTSVGAQLHLFDCRIKYEQYEFTE